MFFLCFAAIDKCSKLYLFCTTNKCVYDYHNKLIKKNYNKYLFAISSSIMDYFCTSKTTGSRWYCKPHKYKWPHAFTLKKTKRWIICSVVEEKECWRKCMQYEGPITRWWFIYSVSLNSNEPAQLPRSLSHTQAKSCCNGSLLHVSQSFPNLIWISHYDICVSFLICLSALNSCKSWYDFILVQQSCLSLVCGRNLWSKGP